MPKKPTLSLDKPRGAKAAPAPRAPSPVAAVQLWSPDRGEVIWINHSPAQGAEVPDLHPMLVLSTQMFNEKTGMVIGLPMTHSERYEGHPFAIPIEGPKGRAYIVVSQPKSFDWRARGAKPHPLGGGHQAQLEEALVILQQILGL